MEGQLMTKKEKRIFNLLLAFSAFLLICAIINIFTGHIWAAVCVILAMIFYWCIYYAYHEKVKKDSDGKNPESADDTEWKDIN